MNYQVGDNKGNYTKVFQPDPSLHDYPEAVDWRTKGAVTAVKDQVRALQRYIHEVRTVFCVVFCCILYSSKFLWGANLLIFRHSLPNHEIFRPRRLFTSMHNVTIDS